MARQMPSPNKLISGFYYTWLELLPDINMVSTTMTKALIIVLELNPALRLRLISSMWDRIQEFINDLQFTAQLLSLEPHILELPTPLSVNLCLLLVTTYPALFLTPSTLGLVPYILWDFREPENNGKLLNQGSEADSNLVYPTGLITNDGLQGSSGLTSNSVSRVGLQSFTISIWFKIINSPYADCDLLRISRSMTGVIGLVRLKSMNDIRAEFEQKLQVNEVYQVNDVLNVVVVRQVVQSKYYETIYINGVLKETVSGFYLIGISLDWDQITTGCASDVAIREVLISPYIIGMNQVQQYVKGTPCLQGQALKGNSCQACNNCAECFYQGNLEYCLACDGGLEPSIYFCCDVGECVNSLTHSCEGPQSPCATCEIYSNNCATCIKEFNSQCVDPCPVGSYLDSDQYTCIACHFTCNYCTTSAFNDCTACPSGRTLDQGQCKQNCATNYYYNQSTFYCAPCASLCDGCTGPTNSDCIACISQAISSGGTCQLCPSGQYKLDEFTCDLCNVECLTCSGPSHSDCTSCSAPKVVQSGVCVNCPDGQFYNAGVCDPCHVECETCSGPNSTDCITCPSGFIISSGSCVACTSSQYSSSVTECSDCDSSCLTCNGGGAQDCTSCQSPRNLVVGQCSSCQEGEFDNSGNCQPCYSFCASCVGPTESDCLECKADLIQQGTPPTTCSQCSIGTFFNSGICTPCHSECLTCSGTLNTDCLSCYGSKVINIVTQQCECPSTTYLTSLNECAACYRSCLQCNGPLSTDCTECGPAYQYNVATSKCISSICPLNNYLRDGVCEACNSMCNECTGSTARDCLECAAGIILFQAECIASCPDGYYLVQTGCQLKLPEVAKFSYDPATAQIVITLSDKIAYSKYLEGKSDFNLENAASLVNLLYTSDVNITSTLIFPLQFDIFTNEIRLRVEPASQETLYASEDLEIRATLAKSQFEAASCFTCSLELEVAVDPNYKASLMADEQIQVVQDAISNGVSFFAPLNWLTAILFDISLRYLWGAINSAQLMQFLILICVPRPSNIHIFLKSLSYANADFTFLEQLGDSAVQAAPIDFSSLQNLPALTICYIDGNMQSQSFLLNYKAKMILLSIYFLALIPLGLIVGCLCRACNCKKCSQKCKSVKSSQTLFRLFLELYIQLAITAFISPSQISFVSLATSINATLHIIGLGFVIIVPLIYGISTLKEVSSFYKKSLPSEEKMPQKIRSKVFLFFFMIHRLGFAIALTSFYGHPRITLQILLPLQTINLIFVIHTRLLQKKIENVMLIIEAVTLLLMLLILVLLESFSILLSQVAVEISGLCFIAIGMLQLFVSLLIAVCTCLRELHRKCKRRRQQMKQDQIFPEQTLPSSPVRKQAKNLPSENY